MMTSGGVFQRICAISRGLSSGYSVISWAFLFALPSRRLRLRGGEETFEKPGKAPRDFAVAGYKVASGGTSGSLARDIRVSAEPEERDSPPRCIDLGTADGADSIEPVRFEVNDRGHGRCGQSIDKGVKRPGDEWTVAERFKGRGDA